MFNMEDSKLKKKNIVIKYFQAEILVASLKEPSASLNDLLVESLESLEMKTAEKRLMEEVELPNNYILIPEHTKLSDKSIYGSLVELSDIKNPLITIRSLKNKSIKIEALFKEMEQQGLDSQSIKTVCYFYINKNNLILQSTKNLTQKDFSTYINWIINKHIPNKYTVLLKTPIMSGKRKILGEIKEIQIADAQMLLHEKRTAEYVAEKSDTSDYSISNRSLISRILSYAKEEGALPDYIPEDVVKVSLKLTVDNRKWQKHPDEEKIRKTLEVNCRNIPDDVVVKLQDGSTITASELHCKKTISINHTLSGLPDNKVLLEEFQRYLGEVTR